MVLSAIADQIKSLGVLAPYKTDHYIFEGSIVVSKGMYKKEAASCVTNFGALKNLNEETVGLKGVL